MIKEEIGKNGIVIEDATIDDVPAIVKLQKSFVRTPEILSDEDAQHGFLVYEMGSEELIDIISNVRHVIKVAKKNEKLIGYLIGYDMKRILEKDPDWLDGFEALDKNIDHKEIFGGDDVIYLKQVAIDRSEAKSGIAKQLFNDVSRASVIAGFRHQIGEILFVPRRNLASEKLIVNNLGFNVIGYQTDKMQRKWTVVAQTLVTR